MQRALAALGGSRTPQSACDRKLLALRVGVRDGGRLWSLGREGTLRSPQKRGSLGRR